MSQRTVDVYVSASSVILKEYFRVPVIEIVEKESLIVWTSAVFVLLTSLAAVN
jgi:hypothetical protein